MEVINCGLLLILLFKLNMKQNQHYEFAYKILSLFRVDYRIKVAVMLIGGGITLLVPSLFESYLAKQLGITLPDTSASAWILIFLGIMFMLRYWHHAGKKAEWLTEKDAHIVQLANNRFSVAFREEMRAIPVLRFFDLPDGLDYPHIENWSPNGFTVDFRPARIPVTKLKFTAAARKGLPSWLTKVAPWLRPRH